MGYLTRAHLWTQALQLLAQFDARRILPDVITYNVALHACGKGSQWMLSADLFMRMFESLVRPNVVTLFVCRSSRFVPSLGRVDVSRLLSEVCDYDADLPFRYPMWCYRLPDHLRT